MLQLGCHASFVEALDEHGGFAWPAPAGTVWVDRDASEVKLSGSATDVPEHQAFAWQLREDLANAFEAIGGPGSERIPLRFSVHFAVDTNRVITLFPCFFYFTLFGCPAATTTAHARVRIQLGDQHFDASAMGESTMNPLYYNAGRNTWGLGGGGQDWWRMAAYRAVVKAVKYALGGTAWAPLAAEVTAALEPPRGGTP